MKKCESRPSSNTHMDIVVPIGSESKFCSSLHFAMAKSILVLEILLRILQPQPHPFKWVGKVCVATLLIYVDVKLSCFINLCGNTDLNYLPIHTIAKTNTAFWHLTNELFHFLTCHDLFLVKYLMLARYSTVSHYYRCS